MKKLSQFKRAVIKNLIPDAVMEANKAIGPVSAYANKHWSDIEKIIWNTAYHAEMDRICKKAGVRV